MNTLPLKTIYAREYQRTHFKKSVFPLFADLRFENELKDGATVSWDYDDDAVADSLDSNDGYRIEGRKLTPETLTVNQKPSHGFVIPGTQAIQDHRPTQQKWARKSMNVIFNKIDGDVLFDLVVNAGAKLDAADFGGSASAGIAVTTNNSAEVFAAAQRILTNQDVIYDENKVFQNNVKLDGGERYPVSAIPAELKEHLLLRVGFKDTGYADKTMKSGFMGPMFGFNNIASTALPFSFRIVFTGTPTNAAHITLGSGPHTGADATAVRITWATTVSAAGQVRAQTNQATSVGHLVAFLNNPYGTVAGSYQGFNRDNLTRQQRRLLDNLVAVDNEDGTAVVYMKGYGTRVVAQSDANGSIDRRKVHAVFGVSRSIGMIMQRTPAIEASAGNLITTGQGTGFVGKQYLAWSLYGRKVFKTQRQQLIDVQIEATNFQEPASVLS